MQTKASEGIGEALSIDVLMLRLTAEIVSAFLSKNSVPAGEIGNLITSTHGSLRGLVSPNQPTSSPQTPAVPIRKSVMPDYLVCLEDGKKFKSLKRHLRVHYGLTPEAYREKWGLPADYPMVAPSYSATRSSLAVKSGLGRKP